jgi:glycosyltransferase involved in cell wall biosynthesis
MDAARILQNEPNLAFLMIGDGTERKKLAAMAAGLPQVRFIPMQPKEKYAQVLAASDACLVTLRPEVLTPVVPSKLLTIMAAARPALASLPLTGDAPKIVNDARAGIVSPAGDAAALACAIQRLKRDPNLAEEYGQSGRAYAIRHFSRPACVRQFEQVLREIAPQETIAIDMAKEGSSSNSYELPTILPK